MPRLNANAVLGFPRSESSTFGSANPRDFYSVLVYPVGLKENGPEVVCEFEVKNGFDI